MNYCRLHAQDEKHTELKIGFGASMFNLTEYLVNESDYGFSNTIYMPIDVGKNFRFEPNISLMKSGDEKFGILGAGFFFKKPIENYNILIGSRFGMTTNGVSMTIIAPTIGGEYFFFRKFSIGAEVQYFGLLGDKKGDNFWATNTNILVRFFF